jgi:hypothetical protein
MFKEIKIFIYLVIPATFQNLIKSAQYNYRAAYFDLHSLSYAFLLQKKMQPVSTW